MQAFFGIIFCHRFSVLNGLQKDENASPSGNQQVIAGVGNS
jgi:hypothetical protein